jgi:DNA-binding transcriptional LysR family regulator
VELRHLRYFCAVADEQSFTFAARRLHVSQSGVSGQVRDLEEELGVALLSRNQRKVSLTPEGAVFLREAREILERANQAKDLVMRASQGIYGKLSIGLCGPATAPFLPRLIREFREKHPGVAVALKDIDPAHQPAALAGGEIDIGFTRSMPPEFRKVLRSELLFREPIVVVLPHGHPLDAEDSVALAELGTDRFILYARENAPDLFDAIIALCRRARFSPRVVDNPLLWQSVLTMVEAGEGISLVPACVQHLRSHGVSFKRLRNRGCQVEVILAWRDDDPDAVRESFLHLLRERRRETERMMRRT